MLKKLENKFIHYCNSKNFEINRNQIEAIKKLQNYYKKNFKSFFFNEATQQYLQESKTEKLTYYKLSEQPFFNQNIRVKVKFRKEQLTMFEFISITIFLSLSILSLTTALYIVNKNKLK